MKQVTANQAEPQQTDGVWIDKLGRRRVPSPTTTADDGTVTHGAEAEAAFAAHLAEVQEHNRRVLAEIKPHELAQLEAWLRTRTRDATLVKPASRPATGRAPREARNTRRRGSRRGTRATSSSSDDPGSEPPAESSSQRLCQLPGCDKPAKRKYCTTQHGDADRQRRHRAKQRLGRLLRFSDRLIVEDGFDRHQRDPYKLFDTELWRGPDEPPHTADRLEEFARKPLAPRRELMLDLAERFRALEKVVDTNATQTELLEREAA